MIAFNISPIKAKGKGHFGCWMVRRAKSAYIYTRQDFAVQLERVIKFCVSHGVVKEANVGGGAAFDALCKPVDPAQRIDYRRNFAAERATYIYTANWVKGLHQTSTRTHSSVHRLNKH